LSFVVALFDDTQTATLRQWYGFLFDEETVGDVCAVFIEDKDRLTAVFT